jgi:hypothetical protein
MKCQNCGHESDQIENICPDCGQPLKEAGRGLLIAGRVLFVIAALAAVFTLVLFIMNNVQNQQDQILDAIRDFRHEKFGTIVALITFLLSLTSYLLMLIDKRKNNTTGRPDWMFTAARILVAIEGVLIIFSAVIGE